MTVQDVPYSTMQDAHCLDICVKPHGRVYTSRLFTQQYLTTTEPLLSSLSLLLISLLPLMKTVFYTVFF